MVEVEKLNKTIDEFESYVSNIRSVSETLSEVEKLFNETKLNKKDLELIVSSLKEIDYLLKENLNDNKLDNEKFKRDLLLANNELKDKTNEITSKLSNELNQELMNTNQNIDKKINALSDEINKNNKHIKNYVDYIAIQNNKSIKSSEDNIVLQLSSALEKNMDCILTEIRNIKNQNNKIESKILICQIISSITFLAIITTFLMGKN